MNRREFLKRTASSAALMSVGLPFALRANPAIPDAGKVLTTTGSIGASEMGQTLVHEHIITIFGEKAQEPAEYDEEKVLEDVVPYLKYIKSLGCNTIVDCSAAYLGRNAALLKKLSEASGINILVSTGLYGAAGDDYVPDYAYDEPPGKLAERWIDEFKNGIHGTGVRPGFVKIGVDSGPLSDIDAKLVRAATMTHLETGLLLQIHTSNNPRAVDQQLQILKEEGVHPSAWVWVHAQGVDDADPLIKAAQKGAWISLDGLRSRNYFNGYGDGRSSVMHHFELLQALKKEKLLDRVLLSHDGSTFPPGDRPKRPYDVLFTTFIPMLKAGGYSDDEINQLIVNNPARAFAIQVRRNS